MQLPETKLQAKIVTQTITRIAVNPSCWPFTDQRYALPYTFKMPTTEKEFCTALAALCKHSVNYSTKEREPFLYEVLGEIFLLLWSEYSMANPPSAVVFESALESDLMLDNQTNYEES